MKTKAKRGILVTQSRDDGVRLPTNVIPKAYNVHLEPDFKKSTFSGSVEVKIDVLEETSEITLHAQDLVIESAHIYIDGPHSMDGFMNAVAIIVDEEQERVTFVFPVTISLGSKVLRITFDGELKEQLSGFYRSNYEIDGETRVMATTQFEDTDARRAFPCWDEPALKAEFTVSITAPNSLDILSNTKAEVTVQLDGDRKIVLFEPTPIMSTYLLAFAVGEFEHLEGTTNSGTIVRVYTTPGKKEQGAFALDVGVKCLEFYEEYFAIPYPLSKLDMIAIPDFAAGAMENWGLVTYRELSLLIDSEKSSTRMMQGVATTVAHELAHQWFGNLVTMEWWTQLWLNEGFASWMSELALDDLFPQWNVWEQFYLNNSGTLGADGLRSTHPIEIESQDITEIGQNFDAISYGKGAAIINMVYAYLGADNFRDGLRLYLQRHAYANAVTEDLWQAFEDASSEPVASMMDSWTKEPGYPMVAVGRTADGDFTLRQSRFLSSGEDLTQEEKAQHWSIPLSYESEKGSGSRTLTYPMQAVQLSSRGDGWLLLNSGHNTFTRVNYPAQIWESLRDAVMNGKLSTLDRAGMLNDLAAFVRAGIHPVSQLLSLLEVYRNETEYIVWVEIIASLGSVSLLLPDEGTSRDEFNKFARSILTSIAGTLGWEEIPGEAHFDTLLRPLVLSAYGHYEDPDTLASAQSRFHRFIKNPSDLNPDLRRVIFELTARNSDADLFDSFIQAYRRVESQEDRVFLFIALGSFRQEDLIREALDFSMSEEVRSQDLIYLFGSLSSDLASTLAWEFVKEHWEELRQRYSGGIMMMSTLVKSVASGFDSEEMAERIEEFFQENPLPEASQAIAQSLEVVRSKAKRVARDRGPAQEWLSRCWARDNS